MKIGIIGYGFVGKALEAGFKNDVKILKIDPKLDTSIIDLLDFNPDAVFICVPTPMNNDSSQDVSILKSVINDLIANNIKCLTVLKSTVLPDQIAEIEDSIQMFVYNPEFLREKYANEDFINSSLIIFGGDKKNSILLADIYRNNTNCVCTEYTYIDSISASLIKYTINSFLATKVSFFNELNQLFKISGTSETWETFISTLSKDSRIGNSHMQVPGHDGRKGFGGACLPKDSNALANYAENLSKPLNVLKEAISTNNNIRGKYNSENSRELEQNINFNGDQK